MSRATSRDTRSSTTREQILTRLLREGRTVSELADDLGLSRNAVRSQLTALERDGWVEVGRRERGGVGKPAFVYELTVEGERSFPRAYGKLFATFLDAASSGLGEKRAEELLREAGRRLAHRHPLPANESSQERIARATEIVEQLGATVELRDRDDGLVIQGFSCPLAEVVSEEPGACAMVEALLAEVLGVPVKEGCEKGARPRCRFFVGRDSDGD